MPATVDGLGRAVSSTDVWGLTTTNTYDSAGRVDTSTGPGGVTDLDYDNIGRLTAYKLDTVTLATPTYRADNATLDPGSSSRWPTPTPPPGRSPTTRWAC